LGPGCLSRIQRTLDGRGCRSRCLYSVCSAGFSRDFDRHGDTCVGSDDA